MFAQPPKSCFKGILIACRHADVNSISIKRAAGELGLKLVVVVADLGREIPDAGNGIIRETVFQVHAHQEVFFTLAVIDAPMESGVLELTDTPVPEPASLILFGSGLAAGAGVLRRKRAARS